MNEDVTGGTHLSRTTGTIVAIRTIITALHNKERTVF
jgi:hypothetical protein